MTCQARQADFSKEMTSDAVLTQAHELAGRCGSSRAPISEDYFQIMQPLAQQQAAELEEMRKSRGSNQVELRIGCDDRDEVVEWNENLHFLRSHTSQKKSV